MRIFLIVSLFVSLKLCAQDATISVDVSRPTASVSPDLHGIFFEEISHGGEGGLYAELIQNRGFEESRIPPGCSLDSGWLSPPATPHYGTNKVVDWKMKWEPVNQWPAWSLETSGKSKATLSLDKTNSLNSATPQSLKVDIKASDDHNKISVVNEGFWGIRVDKDEVYNLSFYVSADNYRASVEASLVGANGNTLASAVVDKVEGRKWKKYTCTLKATDSDLKARFFLTFKGTGIIRLDFVSLFPTKTFKNRPNGMRPELANYLADLKPAFIRWPGGCFVEGISTESAPNWKKSLGPIEERPGTYSPWGYWSSDGIGYHEFLQFCEDIHADAMYVFNCGISCEMRSGVYLSDDKVPAILADILDGIEYAIGPADSKWGALRAKNGHPAPFPLKYVEVGNEQVGERYGKRFNIFYKAIKEKYPQLEILAAMGISHLDKRTVQSITKMDIADEHAYKGIYWPMINYDWYDKYERKDFKLYIGEYACNSGVGNGNMMAALNDATFILGMEKNSDMITMSSYAPLLENVNDTDWPVNLIRFNNSKSFARISYYTIKMLNENKATTNLNTTVALNKQDEKATGYPGKIGLSTWDTQAEFKDIEITQANKVVYKSDFTNRESDWDLKGGKWIVNGGALAQTTDGAWPMAVLKDLNLDTYVLKLKARKTGGPNAFMFPLAIKNDSNYLRVHIGAWWNRVCAFEIISDGADAMVTQPVNLKELIEMNRWYAVEIHVNKSSIECFLDGTLLMTYNEPSRFFSIAGKDEKTGELVIKIVNAKAQVTTTKIQLNNALALLPEGRVITLSANEATDENSFSNPTQFTPKEEVLAGISNDFEYTVKPWSITILRIKIK